MSRSRRKLRIAVALTVMAMLPGVAYSQIIEIQRATYGANCGVPKGNVTGQVAAACNGKASCNYLISYKVLGDPAFGCEKNFIVLYMCKPNPTTRVCRIGEEAGWAGENGRPSYTCEIDCTAALTE